MTQIKVKSNNKIDMAQFAPQHNRSIPNLLSIVRIVLIPFIMLVYFNGHIALSVTLLIASAITDAVDGIIARRFDQVTTLGKVLDPLADKLTQIAIGVCLCFAFPGVIPLAVVLAIKEALMLFWGLRLLKSGRQPFSACWWGKVSTTVFYLGITLIIAFTERLTSNMALYISLIIVLTLLYSMYRYGRLFNTKMHEPLPSK